MALNADSFTVGYWTRVHKLTLEYVLKWGWVEVPDEKAFHAGWRVADREIMSERHSKFLKDVCKRRNPDMFPPFYAEDEDVKPS